MLVFGNEARLGLEAREFTLNGRVATDPEVVWWDDKRNTSLCLAARGPLTSLLNTWHHFDCRYPGVERLQHLA